MQHATTISSREFAKLLRGELRNQFPATRFSVRCDRGTAAGWISISWTDGPSEAVVEKVCHQRRVEVKSFVDGILCRREISTERLAAAQEIIREVVPEFDAYRDGGFYGPDAGRRFEGLPRVRGEFAPAPAPGESLVRWAADTLL